VLRPAHNRRLKPTKQLPTARHNLTIDAPPAVPGGGEVVLELHARADVAARRVLDILAAVA
jgi:hypothetical protein